MGYSRVDKYRELRAGLKDEVGINRDSKEIVIDSMVEEDETDDFLKAVNRLSRGNCKEETIEDTLTEAKTFEQMRQESSEEIDRALRSAKVCVGKEAQYNTRMDILSKIREPEKEIIRVDKFDNVSTSEFAKGYFVENEAIEENPAEEVKQKMTLMERLASMSPVEDAKKAQVVLDEEETADITVDNTTPLEQTGSLEDMLRQIKEKDQREVEKALKQKEASQEIKLDDVVVDEAEQTKKIDIVEKNDRVTNVLNWIIICLVVVFVILCCMIGYQLFF